MKKIVLGFLFFSSCVIADAQSLVRGRVIDKLSREPLELAFVKSPVATSLIIGYSQILT